MAKKVKVDKIEEQEKPLDKGNVSVKPSKRFQVLKKHEVSIDNEIEELYEDNNTDRLYQPQIGGNKLWVVVLVAIIVGLLGGTAASFYILSKKHITFPWGSIDLSQYFPRSQTTIVREQSITITPDERLQTIRDSLDEKIVHIFKVKQAPENGTLPFLEQIYMSHEVLSQGVVVTNDGWVMAPSPLVIPPEGRNDKKEGRNDKGSYIVVDNESQEFLVDDMFIADGFTFLKIEKTAAPISIALPQEIRAGASVFLIDTTHTMHFAKVSQAQYKEVTTPEDLVYSADSFSHTIVLDNRGLVSAFSATYIYSLEGKAIGAIQDTMVIPLWRIASKIDVLIKNKKVVYPYLGIDYVRIEYAPGLTSPLFKDLKNGAVVYGPPISGSPASNAGIKNADVIMSVNDIVLDKDINLTSLIQAKNPGDVVVLTFLRKGEEMTAEVTLGSRPLSSRTE
ncbi:S1C family serine protease [Patescibacteria group bacterium AH-259-L05]|nr:S1C family serine protease [Patescibacteria group bacterium AH-259-L05]